MNLGLIKLFLRFSIAAGFLSAVADRFGLWKTSFAWGSWKPFVSYTQTLLPWLPHEGAQLAAILSTIAELSFGVCLLLGWKTVFFAKISGILLLLFAIAMTFSIGIKKPLDYSVFTASAAAFALSTMKTKFLELNS